MADIFDNLHRDGCNISRFCFNLVRACRPFYRALCFLFSDVLAPPELTHQLTRVGVGLLRSVLTAVRLYANFIPPNKSKRDVINGCNLNVLHIYKRYVFFIEHVEVKHERSSAEKKR